MKALLPPTGQTWYFICEPAHFIDNEMAVNENDEEVNFPD